LGLLEGMGEKRKPSKGKMPGSLSGVASDWGLKGIVQCMLLLQQPWPEAKVGDLKILSPSDLGKKSSSGFLSTLKLNAVKMNPTGSEKIAF
jgi:hypothetical protein